MSRRPGPARQLYGAGLAGVLGGLAILVGIGLLALGPAEWWDTLVARELDGGPYDFLFAAIAGSNVVMIALYFTVVGALLAGDKWDREDRAPNFARAWIFWPVLLEALCVAALGGRAWGFPPFAGALLALAVLGVAATVAYAKLAEHVLGLLAGPTSQAKLVAAEPTVGEAPVPTPPADMSE